MKKIASFDEYLLEFPMEIRIQLEEFRQIVLKNAPKAEESIAYGMPAYKLAGPLVYFGAFKSHIGFYPTPSAIAEFKAELEPYVTSKGAIQFPHGKPFPKKLIAAIIKFRIAENLTKAKSKK